MWFFVVGSGIRAVVKKQILWPMKQEDADDDDDDEDRMKTMRQGLKQRRMNSHELHSQV